MEILVLMNFFSRITESSSWSPRVECMEPKRTATILTEFNKTPRISTLLTEFNQTPRISHSSSCWNCCVTIELFSVGPFAIHHGRIYSADEVNPWNLRGQRMMGRQVPQPTDYINCCSGSQEFHPVPNFVCHTDIWIIVLTCLLKVYLDSMGWMLQAQSIKSTHNTSSQVWCHHIVCHFCLILYASYQHLAVILFPSKLLFGAVDVLHISCLVHKTNTSNQENLLCIWGRQYVSAGNHQQTGGGGHIAIRQLLASHIHVVPCWIHTNLFCFSC